MSSLLDQFVSEAKGHLAEAGQGLLQLETSHGDPEALNNVFRAVHTLKGSAGMFDADALARVLHATEECLEAARNGELALDGAGVDALLAALDQVQEWVDALGGPGELPAGANEVAQRVIAALPDSGGPVAEAAPAPAEAPAEWLTGEWLAALPGHQRREAYTQAVAGVGLVAIDYCPDEGCFFRGEDPLALLREVPDLVALGAEGGGGLRAAEADPFQCQVAFRGVAAADGEAVAHALRFATDQVRTAPCPPALLAQPVGEARGNGEFAAFAEQARGRLDQGELGALREVVADLAGRAKGEFWEASALRWLQTVLDAPEPDTALARALLDSIEDKRPPVLSQAEGPAAEEPARAPGGAEGRIQELKVDPARVDHLMNLAGELMVATNGLDNLARGEGGTDDDLLRALKEQVTQFSRIAEDLKGSVMEVRTLPVAHVFQRYPRLVRDLARKLGKEVRLETEGEDTEADKDMLERLADPLVHLLRNSLDHGLETPEEREAAGKGRTGTLRLSATPQGDQVVIALTDDGRGIDVERVKAKAVDKGILTREAARDLDEEQAVQLIFHSGFSSAEAVSEVSGRGVGMDAVKGVVEDAGGTIVAENRAEGGTRVTLSLPLSLAITRVMMVSVQGQRFGVPLDAVLETLRVTPADTHQIKDRWVLDWRGSYIPLFSLHYLLGWQEAPLGDDQKRAVLVVQVAGAPVGLVVDDFRGETDVVLKPFDGWLAGLPGLAGSAVLGDGGILLILNPGGLLHDG